MEHDPKEQAIVEWLRMVDRPVGTKVESKKDTGPIDE